MGVEFSVSLGREGRVTLPAKIRTAMRLRPGHQLLLDWDEEAEEVRIRPAMAVPRGQSWAYTDEHLAHLRDALVDVREDRVVRPTREGVSRLLRAQAPRTKRAAAQHDDPARIVGVLVENARGEVVVRQIAPGSEPPVLERNTEGSGRRAPRG